MYCKEAGDHNLETHRLNLLVLSDEEYQWKLIHDFTVWVVTVSDADLDDEEEADLGDEEEDQSSS